MVDSHPVSTIFYPLSTVFYWDFFLCCNYPKSCYNLNNMKLLKLIFSILLTFFALFLLLPFSALATNLLVNSGLNDPYDNIPGRVWNGQNEQIASGWQPFYIASNTHNGSSGATRLHWMSSAQFGATFGGIDYHIEGNRAQNIWSAYKFDAGVYQQLSGITPGQAYGFDIAMVTYWRGPGYFDSDGIMVKQVGIDPTGGTDPTSSNIVWSDPDANDKAWVYMDVATTAQVTTITVFAKVQAPENNSVNHTDLDMVYFDAAHVAPAPTTTLNVSSNGTTVDLSWSGSSPAPSWSIKGYEVQVRDHTGSSWTTLQPKNSTITSRSFNGQAGHTYTFRVRTWQKISESYNSDIDMPGPWQEQMVTPGALVSGKVINNQGFGLSGVTVADSDGSASTTTDGAGNYTLSLTNSGIYTLTVSGVASWTVPPPVPVSVQLNNTTYLTFTLRPPDDIVSNGDFESDLSDWQVSGSPTPTTTERHSGAASLHLVDAATLSQTQLISNSYQPLLSFWYKLDSSDANDNFTAEILGTDGLISTNIFTTSANGDWQHVVLPLNLTEVYTGPVGMRFSLQSDSSPATVYLDEVSLGASWGGANRVYLPVIFR